MDGGLYTDIMTGARRCERVPACRLAITALSHAGKANRFHAHVRAKFFPPPLAGGKGGGRSARSDSRTRPSPTLPASGAGSPRPPGPFAASSRFPMNTPLVDAIGMIGAVLTTVCWVPQAIKIIGSRETQAISLA